MTRTSDSRPLCVTLPLPHLGRFALYGTLPYCTLPRICTFCTVLYVGPVLVLVGPLGPFVYTIRTMHDLLMQRVKAVQLGRRLRRTLLGVGRFVVRTP